MPIKSILAETNFYMKRYKNDGLSPPTKQTIFVYHPANGSNIIELASGPFNGLVTVGYYHD